MGVPSGIIWEINPFKLENILNRISLDHNIRDKNIIMPNWDVKGKLKEKTEKKFITKITKINPKEIKFLTLLNSLGFKE